jgi:hypothetical protein
MPKKKIKKISFMKKKERFTNALLVRDHNKYAIRLISIGQLQNRDHMIIVTI